MYLIKRPELVLVGVHYYIPDYHNLIQTFHWQTDDYIPDLPRVHKFLNYWKDHIDATIKEVEVTAVNRRIRISDILLEKP